MKYILFTILLLDPAIMTDASWVRGVNVGGWLVMERFITPYQFALTSCHVEGDICWYPGQLGAPPTDHPDYKVCDLQQCNPYLKPTATGDHSLDYPLDEYTLSQAFANQPKAGEDWFNFHFEHFITKEDVKALKESGITHLRVPLPHFILGDVLEGEPWIAGNRWEMFVRFARWCREYNLSVWPDIHTAPGSQNGFDNSGQALDAVSCQGWSNNPENVERTLQFLRDITAEIVKEGIDDVITGFGLLNEPFKDCNREAYESYIDHGLDIVRGTLGEDTSIYVSDMFLAKTFNNGNWWLDPKRYHDTYLDSHYYHVFEEKPRAFSPRQHIAFVCQNEERDAVGCCYQEPWRAPGFLGLGGRNHNAKPSEGVKRMIGEWSAAVDTLPIAMMLAIYESIKVNGTALHFDRQIAPKRQEFLKHFNEAQIVAYEAKDAGVAAAWFYWTAKMEGGAFAEWDFLRGVKEGWIPKLPSSPTQPSEELYGTCYDIIFRTDDSMDVIHEFPDPSTIDTPSWETPIDDDVVVSHGESLVKTSDGHYIPVVHHGHWWLGFAVASAFCIVVVRYYKGMKTGKKYKYTEIASTETAGLSP